MGITIRQDKLPLTATVPLYQLFSCYTSNFEAAATCQAIINYQYEYVLHKLESIKFQYDRR